MRRFKFERRHPLAIVAGALLALMVSPLASAAAAETAAATAAAAGPAVLIGLDAEFGHRTSTSAPAIRQGILLAIDEINARGGVLGGRRLELVERDNRSVPARAEANIRELATLPELVAVFCGKFSPVVLDTIAAIHELRLPLLDPWAAVDEIVDNGHTPNYVFRLSLRDGWAVPALLEAARRRGLLKVGLLAPNTSWGRSSQRVAERHLKDVPGQHLVGIQWYNWGEKTLLAPYRDIVQSGAQAIILIANETEGALLVREMAALPAAERLPVFSHWGVSGGDFPAMTEGRLDQVDFSVVQTFTFVGNTAPRALAVLAALKLKFGIEGLARLPSQVGLAHAYDLTHILARAIDLAGNTDRAAIRDALERVGRVEGVIQTYDPPFTPDRHEALKAELLFVGRFTRDGVVRSQGGAP